MNNQIRIYLIILVNFFLLLALSVSGIYYYGKKSLSSVHETVSLWGYPTVEKQKVYYETNSHEFAWIDKDGTRINELITTQGNKHVLITGGSNTFGHFHKDNETLAYRISQDESLKSFNPYIFAYPGWGLNNVLAFFQNKNLSKRVINSNGVMIYQHINDHFARFCGMDTYFSWNQGISPWYEKVGNKIVRKGFFSQSPMYHLFLFKLGLRKLFRIKGSKKVIRDDTVNKDCVETYVAGLVELKRVYHKKFSKGKFLIINLFQNEMFPHSKTNIYFEKLLNQNGLNLIHSLKFLNENSVSVEERKTFFDHTGHLNGKYYQTMLPMYRRLILE